MGCMQTDSTSRFDLADQSILDDDKLYQVSESSK